MSVPLSVLVQPLNRISRNQAHAGQYNADALPQHHEIRRIFCSVNCSICTSPDAHNWIKENSLLSVLVDGDVLSALVDGDGHGSCMLLLAL